MRSPHAIPYVNGEDAHSKLSTGHTTRTTIGPRAPRLTLAAEAGGYPRSHVCSIQCPVPIVIRHKLSASSLPEQHDGHVVLHGSRCSTSRPGTCHLRSGLEGLVTVAVAVVVVCH